MYPWAVDTATERLYRLLLTYPRESWIQKDLAARAGCSRGHTSRVVAALVSAGALARPYKNRVVLTSPAKLLTLWAARRVLPPPAFVATDRDPETVEDLLRESSGVGLTLFRAAWHRTKFLMTRTVEMYVPGAELRDWIDRLGSASEDPARVVLYPTAGAELEGLERIDGLPLVSVPQTYVDLIAVGGQGSRVAIHLARAAGLLEG